SICFFQAAPKGRPRSFFCFWIMELKPPMVSASRPLMDPLRSRIKTISVKSFPMFLPPLFSEKNVTVRFPLQSHFIAEFIFSGRLSGDNFIRAPRFSASQQVLIEGKKRFIDLENIII